MEQKLKTKLLKFIVGISFTVLTLAIIIVGSTYWCGYKVESQYKHLLTQLNATKKINATLTFQRGLFSSKASIDLYKVPHKPSTTTTQVDAVGTDMLKIVQNITHGPLLIKLKSKKLITISLARIYTTLGANSQTKLAKLFNTENPFSLTTELDFSGQGITKIQGTPIRQTTSTNFSVTWSGLQGEITHSQDFTKLAGNIIAPQLIINQGANNLKLINAKINFTSTQYNTLAIGNNTLSIENIIYSKDAKQLLKLANSTIASTLALNSTDSQKLDYHLSLTVKNSQILKQVFSENTYNLLVRSVDAKLLTTLHTNNQIKKTALPDISKALSLNQTNISLAVPKYFSLALVAFANLQLHKPNALVSQSTVIRSDKEILRDIYVAIAAKLDQLVASQVLLERDGQYQLYINCDKKGQFFLNGNIIDKPEKIIDSWSDS